MPVKDKRTELQGPPSLSPASLTLCLMSPSTLLAPRGHEWSLGPIQCERVHHRTTAILQGQIQSWWMTPQGWERVELLLISLHLWGVYIFRGKSTYTPPKKCTCTYIELGYDLVRDHTLKWPCFWWAVPHGGGRKEKGGDDEIPRLSPDRLGTRPLIVLDVMWMTSQDTEYRFITCSSPIIHHQVNHCSWCSV